MVVKSLDTVKYSKDFRDLDMAEYITDYLNACFDMVEDLTTKKTLNVHIVTKHESRMILFIMS